MNLYNYSRIIVFKSSYAIPKCGSGNILVRVKAGAINPVDYKVNRLILGKVVGLDFSGIVEAVGANVTKFAIGDEIYGKAPGSLADFAVVNPEEVALKPKNLSFVEAAAMPLANFLFRELSKKKYTYCHGHGAAG